MTQEHKATITAEAKGTDQAAKGLEKVVQAEEKLAAQTKRAADAAADAAGSVKGLMEQTTELARASGVLFVELGKVFLLMKGGWTVTRRLSGGVKSLTKGWASLVTVLKTHTHALLRGVSAIRVTIYAVAAIRAELRREIEDRKRLIGVMREQVAAMNEIKGEQRNLKSELERVAGRRRGGGFTPEASRAALGGAESARKQFSQLEQGDVVAAFGAFGDVEGLSQEDLTNLAILASQGKLDTDEKRGADSRKGYAKGALRRYRKDIEKFRRTKTQQGQGTGAGRSKPNLTEQGQEIARQAFTKGEATDLVSRYLETVLLPGTDVGAFIEQARMHGSVKAMREATVGPNDPTRGVTARGNAFLGDVEVGQIDQPGYLNQFLEWVGIQKNFVKFQKDQWEKGLAEFEKISKEGLAGYGVERADPELIAKIGEVLDKLLYSLEHARGEGLNLDREDILRMVMRRLKREGLIEEDDTRKITQREWKEAQRIGREKETAQGPTIVKIENHMQHARIVYPDADAVRRNTINGESDMWRREVG